MKYIPANFNADKVLEGLHKAMGFGEPTRADDKATFFFPSTQSVPEAHDQDNVPFDPDIRPADNSGDPKTVYCVVEFFDRAGEGTRMGDIQASRICVTLLDPEWQEVKDFSFIVAGGDKYFRSKVEPPVALGSIDVWTVWAVAEDER